MKNIDDDLILDIARIAHLLNQNSLNWKEYVDNGGQFSKAEFDEWGGFDSRLELAGLKLKE